MLVKTYLGKALIGLGFITQEQLEAALERQKEIVEKQTLGERLRRITLVTESRLCTDQEGSPLLGQVLTEMAYVTSEQLEQALKAQEASFNDFTSIEKERLGTVIEIGSLVNATNNLAEVLRLIMMHANRVTQSMASTLMLLDDRTGELVFSVPTGSKADEMTDIRIPPGSGIAGWVAQHKKALVVPDVRKDPRFYKEIDLRFGFETKSILCVPLKTRSKLIGVLEVINKEDGTVFTEEDRLLLTMFGYQASVAIETARLQCELKDQLEECRRAEKKARESEEKYQSLYDEAPDMYFTVGPDGTVTSLNRFGAEYLGYSKTELLGNPVWKIVHPDDLELVQNQVKGIFRDRQQRGELEFRKVRKNGSILSVRERTCLVFDAEGNPVELRVVCRDVTERKKAELALRESEKKFREMVENINDVIFTTDESGVITYVSPAIERVSEYEPSDLIGRNVFELIHPDDLVRVVERFADVLSGQLGPTEYRVLSKSGAYRWVRSSSRPMASGEGGTVLRGVLTDVTETKYLEQELRQAQKMESIGTLAGGIAHEFNNILGIIIGNTELAIDDVPEWNPASESLKEIRTASLRGKDVVRHLLSFARKSRIDRKPLHIGPIVRDTLKLMRASIPSSIEILTNISCGRDVVLADPTQINQIVMNLSTNAAHAMQEKGGVLEVTLKEATIDETDGSRTGGLTPGDYLQMTFRDTGCGIEPGIIDRIFDPFFTTKDVAHGTGMGLSVVHGIVQSCDGAIQVRSDSGNGTVVEVLFPLTDAEEEIEVQPHLALPTGTEHILFVDDEASLVMLIGEMLGRLGYRVTTSSSSLDALKIFRTSPDSFDLVMTDMAMPGMAGTELTREILAVRPEVPVILCTGYSEKVSEDTAAGLGICKYVEKPFDIRTLALTVRKILDGQ